MNVDDGLADLLERTLSDRAGHAPSGTEAVDRVLRAAPARSRRRRVLTVTGCVASSMAVVAVAVAVLSPEPGPTPAREPTQAVASSGPTNGLAVSVGWDRDGLDERGDVRTWVYEGLAVDVPASWRAVGRRCDQPGSEGVLGPKSLPTRLRCEASISSAKFDRVVLGRPRAQVPGIWGDEVLRAATPTEAGWMARVAVHRWHPTPTERHLVRPSPG